VALETANALVALLVGYLVYGRFRQSRRTQELLVVTQGGRGRRGDPSHSLTPGVPRQGEKEGKAAQRKGTLGRLR
jgi:hypothetical protein